MQGKKSELREKKFAEIEKLRAGGMTIVQAAEQAGVKWQTYYSWKKRVKAPIKRRRVKAPVSISVPLVQSSRLVALVGSPSDVAAALERISSGGAV